MNTVLQETGGPASDLIRRSRPPAPENGPLPGLSIDIDILIRDNLRIVMESSGLRGIAWLAELPAQVERLCSSWSIEIGEVLVDVDGVSWIATVGSDAILKVGWPHREAAYDAAGLRFFDGRGAVRLPRSSEDGFALLMERCLPGQDLWAIGVDEGNAVAAEVLRRLWRPAVHNHGFELLSGVVEEWIRSWPSGEYPSAMVAAASEIGRSLSATQPEIVVLHGDFSWERTACPAGRLARH